jgi:hypothetical protein
VAKEVMYHSSCRNSFENLARSKKSNSEKKERSEWALKKEIHAKAWYGATVFDNELIISLGGM